VCVCVCGRIELRCKFTDYLVTVFCLCERIELRCKFTDYLDVRLQMKQQSFKTDK
jgi:hypothetical protein